ncbi:hypothetical protein [Streptomyces tubercidicus]|uniref:hypothetical protein n=1 Tax=Streptomyces tubercidicus TaxID=47759 RepID=UPI0036A0049A
MEKLNPDALATTGNDELDSRKEVQEVTQSMIFDWVVSEKELPPESARPFAGYIHAVWDEYNEDGENTNRQVLEGALEFWRGR